MEVGPQPNGVLRADIYTLMKEALDLTFEFVQKFNAGENQLFLFLHTLGWEKNSKLQQSPLQCCRVMAKYSRLDFKP